MNIMQSLFHNLVQKEVGWKTVFSLGNGGKTKSTREMYFGIIYACMDAIATKVSETKWSLQQLKGKEWVEVENHPILPLLRKPNATMSFTDMLYLMSSHIDAAGRVVIYPVRTALASGRILELQLLNPLGITPVIDNSQPYTAIKEYRYSNGANVFKLQPNEIVNILRPDPFNPAFGISTIQMARYEGTSEINSLNMNNAFYQNGAFPGGVLHTDQQIAPDIASKLKAQIKAAYEGVDNAYRMMFLTHGFKYDVTSPSQKDIQYVEQRKLNRDQILTIFKTPKSVMAISDQLNKATAEVEYAAWIGNVIKPRLELIFDKLNTHLLPLFGLTEGYALKYVDPTPQDKSAMLLDHQASVNVWKTVNEVRAEENMDPIEGGDELIKTPEPTDESEDEKGKDNPDDDKEDEKDNEKDDKKEDKHLHKETHPDPKKVRGKDNKTYVKKRNAYMQFKQANYSQTLALHFNDFIKLYNKAAAKTKDIEDDFEESPEVIFHKIMPPQEKQNSWKLGLYLLVLKAGTEIWKTAQNQLAEAYELQSEMTDHYERLLAARSSATSKSIADTLFKQVKTTIAQEVSKGNTDLRAIKKVVGEILKDQKQWKVDQIAATELSWTYGAAQREIYKDNNVKQVKWICGADPCEECAKNENETREIGKLFPSGQEAEPVHPNCLCMTIPQF